MAKCEICGKDVAFGIKVSHSHRRSNRTWKPNIKRVRQLLTVPISVFMPAPVACVPAKLLRAVSGSAAV